MDGKVIDRDLYLIIIFDPIMLFKRLFLLYVQLMFPLQMSLMSSSSMMNRQPSLPEYRLMISLALADDTLVYNLTSTST